MLQQQAVSWAWPPAPTDCKVQLKPDSSDLSQGEQREVLMNPVVMGNFDMPKHKLSIQRLQGCSLGLLITGF